MIPPMMMDPRTSYTTCMASPYLLKKYVSCTVSWIW